MRILVIGGGGREHAIVEALARSRHEPEIFCAPGNGGTAELAQNLALDIEDPADVLDWIERTGTRIDLVVVGPEAPLVAGIANLCAAHGIPCFGPPASGAQLEGSKWFAKELMTRHGIPTAPARLAELEEAGRQRPQAAARLDVAAAQQHLVAPDRDRAHHVQRIDVVHRPASWAHRTLAVVVGGDEVLDRGAAGSAVLDVAGMEHGRQCSVTLRPRRPAPV